ncbi:glycosyltransferase family 4 protein [Nostocaceae cyanobacterium CENA369]|uniref:Glycosyltransferase family 4 protein n=1 Tax=Dendronalium phyllosphericum CENA369 TaxID=1725256 RepID=A0A8J7I5H4_9NOST|nr:glycosyltransferase family 4 protein [Dendronalium phyllosphericum]MBH8576315.1 glycosyltransferase family 4 protein [Dendronalium phyllosphericum CENA369]
MNSKPKVLVAQLGARKHYQEPLLFHQWGILNTLYTDFYSGHNVLTNLLRHPHLYNRLPNFLKKGLERHEPNLKGAKIIHFPIFGYSYVKALNKASPQKASEIFIEGGREFCQRIIKHGLGEIDTIYGFNSACLELFEYAKSYGIRCILDQTLADYSLVHELLLEEEERWQGWSLTPFTVSDADLELMQREHQEQDLANRIICGSNFVKDSLIARGVDSHKISVVPLGRLKNEKSIRHQPLTQTPREQGDELKILFVGSVGLRKGIPYLLEALRQMKGNIPFTCKIVGSLEIKPERIAEYSDVCEFLGRIPRSQVKDLYTWADVFVLPSICEGSAMVTYEALSSGVPIITTYNSGSIIRDEIDGFIIPIRNIEAIVDNLIKIYVKGNYFQNIANNQEYLKGILQESENHFQEVMMSQ